MVKLLEFKVTNQTIKRVDKFDPATDSVDYLQATFNFATNDWNGKGKTALFRLGTKTYAVVINNNQCIVPYEVLVASSESRSGLGCNNKIFLTVVGTSGTTRITTKEIRIELATSGYTEGETPAEPTADVYDQILTAYGEVQETLSSTIPKVLWLGASLGYIEAGYIRNGVLYIGNEEISSLITLEANAKYYVEAVDVPSTDIPASCELTITEFPKYSTPNGNEYYLEGGDLYANIPIQNVIGAFETDENAELIIDSLSVFPTEAEISNIKTDIENILEKQDEIQQTVDDEVSRLEIITDVLNTRLNKKADSSTVERHTEALKETANALKGSASGEVVRVDDVSPIEHTAKARVSGKNIISYPFKETTKTVSGITFTDNRNGSVTANGTATANVTFSINTRLEITSAGVYTLSGCPQGGSGIKYMLAANYYVDDVETTGVRDIGNGYSISLKENNDVKIYIYIASGVTVSNLTFYPQLELGDTATEYEPYIDPSTVTVTRYGVDENDNPQTYTPATDGTVEFVSLSPTMTLLTDTQGVNIDLEYNQDTNKAMQNVKDDVKTLDDTVAKILENGGGAGGNGGSVDLSNYYTKEEVDEKIGDIETALTDIDTMLDEMLGGEA